MKNTLAIALVLAATAAVSDAVASGDCNGNGIPDATELSSASHLDTNGNGKPDSCEGLSVDTDRISLQSGGSQELRVELPGAMGGQVYWMLGTLAGTSPGCKAGVVSLPLNTDGPGGYMQHTLMHPNSAILQGGFGIVNAYGEATATFTLPAASYPELAGHTVHHAFVLFGPYHQNIVWASNAVALHLDP